MWRFKYLDIEDKIKYLYMDLIEFTNIIDTIKKVMPDEVYNLAAQSFVQTSFSQPLLTTDIDAIGVLRILEALRMVKSDTKFYQASTSEMFGKVQSVPQTEKTPFYPRSPYGVAKLYAYWICVNYRESYNMYTSNGILFNHESPLRGEEFITRKITHAVARIKFGLQDKITLGNLDSKRDWGYAKEYVEAMYLMLQQKTADDYVVATGETHTVREFVENAFKAIDITIQWKGKGVDETGVDAKSGKALVTISPEYFRPAEVELLIGDASKAKKAFGWQSKTKFHELLKIMVDSDMKMVEAELKEKGKSS
jgi:GDPmannose 4,6-dehydratase